MAATDAVCIGGRALSLFPEAVQGVLIRPSQDIAPKVGSWVKVTNDATSETGWIYARYDATIAISRARNTKAVGPETDGSFWTNLREWFVGP